MNTDKKKNSDEIQAITKWWINALGSSPSDEQLEKLEKEILLREQNIKQAEKWNDSNKSDADSLLYVKRHKETHKALIELLKRYKGDKEIQVGRPNDFDKNKSVAWYNELSQKSEFQHSNGKPHKTNIREEIRQRHKELTGFLPSLRTIKRHI